MKITLKLEELVMFTISLYYFDLLPYPWWFAALFLTPGLSMLGYLSNSKVATMGRICNCFWALHNNGQKEKIKLDRYPAGKL